MRAARQHQGEEADEREPEQQDAADPRAAAEGRGEGRTHDGHARLRQLRAEHARPAQREDGDGAAAARQRAGERDELPLGAAHLQRADHEQDLRTTAQLGFSATQNA